MLQTLFGHRQANQPAAVLGHEIDDLGSDMLGGDGQIALVFAVFVVDDDNHAARAELFYRFFDRHESHWSDSISGRACRRRAPPAILVLSCSGLAAHRSAKS